MKAKDAFPLTTMVEVDWVDSAARGGWRTLDEYSNVQNLTCRSVGYVLRRDRQTVVLIQSQGANDSCSDSITIPMCAVKRIRRLK